MRSGGGGDMKSFFRQQKAHAGSLKPTGGVSKKAAAQRSHHVKPAAQDLADEAADATRRRVEEDEEVERMVREFDMDMRYGPCLGLTRPQRWRRAAALGLAPPPAVIAVCSDNQPCLWEGRV